MTNEEKEKLLDRRSELKSDHHYLNMADAFSGCLCEEEFKEVILGYIEKEIVAIDKVLGI